MSTTTLSRPAPPRLDSATRLLVTLLLVSAFVVVLNETIISVAITDIMTDLGITAATGQWLTTAFMLTMAVVIPVTGFLLQRFATRGVFLAAMSLFATGTLLAALAPGFAILLMGRVVQASGTAMMMPLLMTTLMTVVPPASRGRVMGNVSIVMAVAPAIGPAASGLILSALAWRWIFWIVLPIALLALALGAARVPNVTTPKQVPLDVLSVVLSAFAFGGLIYGLSAVAQQTEGTPLLPWWASVGLGLLLLAGFIARQVQLQRTDTALLDLRVFSASNFTVALAIMVGLMLTLFGTIILLPIFLQQALRLGPLTVGLTVLPGGLLMGLLGPVVGRVYDRYGPRVLTVPGALVITVAMWLLATLDEHAAQVTVMTMHVVLSFGLGLLFTPLFTASLGSLPASLYSHGSAVVGTVQQLAGAAGTAMFIVLFTLGQQAAAAEGAAAVEAVATGTHWAFLSGSLLAPLVVIAAFFVRKPTHDAAEVELAAEN